MIDQRLLLVNGLLATFTKQNGLNDSPKPRRVDILVENGVIAQIAEPKSIKPSAETTVIDASDAWVAPGFVDTHR
jgi:cytosine/adenosine deaminase-related metal-dependent hydrolase